MKSIINIVGFLSLFVLQVAGQAVKPFVDFDVQAYQFKIKVFENNAIINATATIDILPITKINKPKKLLLNLVDKNRYGKGMVVTSITNSKMQALAFQHVNSVLEVNIPAFSSKTYRLIINYNGEPDNGLIIGKNKFGDKTWFGDNWPNRARFWLPCVDHPADKATVTWMVDAPEKYTVVANGLQQPNMGNIRFFSEPNPIPVKVATIGIAQLSVKQLKFKDSISVNNYMYPKTFAKQPKKMDVALEVLSFFDSIIGPYPFAKLNNVQSTTMFGGMENANNIFYDEHVTDRPFPMEDLIAHEIAHQWFGNSVTEKDFSHIWLSEGFATFFTNYYLEKKYGEGYVKKRFVKDYSTAEAFLLTNSRPVIDTTKDLMSLLNANSYQKAGLFLQALRLKIGEDNFILAVKNYYAKYKFKNADTNDFKKEVALVVKTNLDDFFKTWLYTATLPKMQF